MARECCTSGECLLALRVWALIRALTGVYASMTCETTAVTERLHNRQHFVIARLVRLMLTLLQRSHM